MQSSAFRGSKQHWLATNRLWLAVDPPLYRTYEQHRHTLAAARCCGQANLLGVMCCFEQRNVPRLNASPSAYGNARLQVAQCPRMAAWCTAQAFYQASMSTRCANALLFPSATMVRIVSQDCMVQTAHLTVQGHNEPLLSAGQQMQQRLQPSSCQNSLPVQAVLERHVPQRDSSQFSRDLIRTVPQKPDKRLDASSLPSNYYTCQERYIWESLD